MSQLSSSMRRSNRPGWLIPVVAVAGVLLLLAMILGSSYNGLVTKRNGVDQQFANIDVQLQRRFDLIPNLASAVRSALGQEQAVFGAIAEARTRYAGSRNADEKVEASNQLDSGLARLLVIVEQYPQLQSNQNIRDLQVQVEGTENRISQERRQYNAVVTDYNNAVQRFPRNIVAGLFGFDRRTLFETAAASREAPTVDLGVAPTTPPAAR